jgi:O-antigen/teichoic acid export membrane protein
MNFGISHSVNAIIAIRKNREWYAQKVVGASLTMLIGLSCIVALLFLAAALFHVEAGARYGFSKYALIVAGIGILGYFNTLFSNIFRIYGRLFEIAFHQTAFPVLMLLALILFRGEDLLWALAIANLLAVVFPFILFVIKTPVAIKPLFVPRLFKFIQIKGWHLFVYNTSFYMIMISTRSFVSSYYDVNEFGYFTFAFTLANVVMLLLDSFSFLIYPKLLNRLASATAEKTGELLSVIRNTYITTSHLLVHIAVLFFPLFLLLFPQYAQSKQTFRLIALTLALYAGSFGCTGLLIAKGKEKQLSYTALLALVINVIMTYTLIVLLKVTFAYAIMATILSYILFVFCVEYASRQYLNLQPGLLSLLSNMFPFRLFVPYLLSICFVVLPVPDIYFIAPLVLFVAFNSKTIIALKHTAKNISLNPELINI